VNLVLCSNSVRSPIGCREQEGRFSWYGPHANGAGELGKSVGFTNWAKTRGKEEALVNRNGRGKGEADGLHAGEKKKRAEPA
jgi:hypothetical protein